MTTICLEKKYLYYVNLRLLANTRGAPLIFEHFRNHDSIEITRDYLNIYIAYAILYTTLHTITHSLLNETLYDFKYVIKWVGYNDLTFED